MKHISLQGDTPYGNTLNGNLSDVTKQIWIEVSGKSERYYYD